MQLSSPTGPFGSAATNLDILAWMTQAIDLLMNTSSAAVTVIARSLGLSFACIRILKTCLDGATHALLGQPALAAIVLVMCCVRIAFVNFVISYWVNPMPVIGLSVPDFVTALGKEIATIITLGSLDMVLSQMNNAWNNFEHPPMWNFWALVMYYVVLLFMTALDSALFFIMFFGFFAVALGKLFGSIHAALYLLPGYESKFLSMINYLWNYGMYRATAAAFVFIATTFLVRLFNSVLNDLTIAHVAGMALVLLTGIAAAIVTAFRVPHLNAEIWASGGHSGGDFGRSFRNLAAALATGRIL